MGKKMYEQNDNTFVKKPITLQFFTRKAPSQEEQQEMAKQGYNWDGKNWRYVGTISDKGGKPSSDNRTAAERNKDYWSLSGASDRWETSWNNGTNPVKGALDNGLGYANPVTAVANTAYDAYNAYDLLSSPQGLAKTWGLVRLGKLGRAAVSAAGDALAVADLVPGTPNTPTVRTVQDVAREASRTRRSINIPERLLTNIADTDNIIIPGLTTTPRQIAQSIPLTTPKNAFHEALDSYIPNASPSDKAVLEAIRSGNWDMINLLDVSNYYDLFKQHPDYRFTNTSSDHDNLRLLVFILKLRDQIKSGNIDRNVLRPALGTNIYDDNPLYLEIKEHLPENLRLLPARVRDIVGNRTWDPRNNEYVSLLVEHGDDYILDFFHPFSEIRTRFLENAHIPTEYRHIDTYIYDGSYPFEYYRGDRTPDRATPELLLSKGLLGNSIGLFTDKLLASISQDVFDKFLERSWNQGVEGSHGVEFWGKPRNAETALEFLLTRGSAEAREDMRSLLLAMQQSQRSGYVNFPHSLSIDSWPIWESQSLKLRSKTAQVPTELLKNSSYKGRGFFMPEGIPYAKTNALGLGNRMEASPELLKYIQDNKGLKMGDFNILDMGNGMSDIFHNGTRVGTLKMLSSDEALDKFNAQRKQIYRKNPEFYPGDAVVSGSPYQYYVPFSPRLIKKEGGKLNVKLVKRRLK